MKEIRNKLKACKSFLEFLTCVRDTEGLTFCYDNGHSWIEYDGEEVEGTAK